MTPERWQQIEKIYDSALELEESQRVAFLKKACAGDEALRQEVESLLRSEPSGDRFIEEPVLEVAAKMFAQQEPRSLLGQRIGSYQILSLLGTGGMGVVYKAHDPRLKRFVAIKVLPAEQVSDPERKRRFIQEARAASALNHPNIITIHDIGSESGIDFVVMEYLAGKTLDQLIPRKGLRLHETLKLAVQIADALAKAHSAGIIHRDVKPTNVMVTDDGLVKVLDFGLAKLTEVVRDEEGTRTTLLQTEEGTIAGTLSYMSPEQAEGKKVDARSDMFSFGSVLYEMATGQQAFHGDSKMSTLAAIMNQEPKPISQLVPGSPRDLEKIITRCLRKAPERRWQDMADLKVALEDLKEESDSGKLEAPLPVMTRHRSYTALALILFAGVVLVVGGWFWFGRSRAIPPEVPLTAVPLTSYPGSESYPSFSPDGSQVAFSWNGEKQNNYDIYVKVIGSEPHFRLTTDPARDYSPTWSPDGRWIAFCRDLPGAKVAVWLISPLGGPERKMTETNSADPRGLHGSLVTWCPDSRSLVIGDSDGEAKQPSLFLLSVETGQKRRLTSPPGTEGFGDRDPAFSPDGHTLAFSRWGALYLLDLSDDFKPLAEPKRLTSDTAFSSPVWTPDGNELVFYSPFGISSGLWRMPVLKPAKPQRLPFASNQAHRPAVSRQGKRLAYAVRRDDNNIWRVDLLGPDRKPGNLARFISSTQGESAPAYSPDGKKIAFESDRSGGMEIWVCDKDGSNQVKLTSSGSDGGIALGPQWSPDNQRIAFWGGPIGSLSMDIYVIDANGGAPRQMTTDPAEDSWPNWSRDGKWIYFDSSQKGGRIWKISSKEGEAIPVSRDNGADWPHESPDGKWLYYSKGWPGPQSVWRMPVAGGEATKVLDAVDFGWTMGKDGIYFFTVADEKGHADLSVYEFATGKTRKIRTMERPAGAMTVSPDGRRILYTQLDDQASDLMLVENFR